MNPPLPIDGDEDDDLPPPHELIQRAGRPAAKAGRAQKGKQRDTSSVPLSVKAAGKRKAVDVSEEREVSEC
jgi:hypothetical protein